MNVLRIFANAVEELDTRLMPGFSMSLTFFYQGLEERKQFNGLHGDEPTEPPRSPSA